MRIIEADDFVVLDEIDAVGLQAPQRFVELPGRFRARSAVDLGHEKHARAVAVAEHRAHPALALAFVVVPRVVEEGDPAIDGRSDDPIRQRLIHVRQGQVPATEANG